MQFSKQLGYIATFVVAALVVYLIGVVLRAVWPMWRMMWGMPGFGFGSLIALVALLIGLVAIWLVTRNEREVDAAAGTAATQCPQCQAPIAPDYVLCPECHTALGAPCPECRRPLKAHWTRCPFCGVDVARRASPEAFTATVDADGDWQERQRTRSLTPYDS